MINCLCGDDMRFLRVCNLTGVLISLAEMIVMMVIIIQRMKMLSSSKLVLACSASMAVR